MSLSAAEFVDERLENLSLIDEKIVSLLEHVSGTINTVKEGQINQLQGISTSDPEKNFETHVKKFFSEMELMTSRLRREVIIMDKKTLFNSLNQNDVSLLPKTLDKKASWVGDWKFKSEITEAQNLLNNDKNFDKCFEFNNTLKKEESVEEMQVGSATMKTDISLEESDSQIDPTKKVSVEEKSEPITIGSNADDDDDDDDDDDLLMIDD